MGQEHDAAALRVVRHLTGGRWTWPPVEVREVYPLLTDRVILRGNPVRDVVSVKDYGSGEDVPYTQSGRHLVFDDATRVGLCGRNRKLDITYQYGSPPPGAIQRAVSVLASEMVLADDDSTACRLPERVTSINRQGTSWTVLDPMDFIDNNRTGVYEIDLVLNSYGTSRARSRVFSPEHPPPDRLSTTLLAEPVGG